MQPNHFVATIDPHLFDKLKEDLIAQGFTLSCQQDAHFRASHEGIHLVLYHSGKLVVQGKKIQPFIEFYLEPEILKAVPYTHPDAAYDTTSRIGVDEAGKGDFFGPLVIGAVYIDATSAKELLAMGVKDSKQLNDPTAIEMAKKISDKVPTALISIFPEKYNLLYERFKNLNSLLAWGHATAIDELHQKTQCKKVVCDQFASSEAVILRALKQKNLELDVTQRHRAESDLAVAAASVIARAGFLNGLKTLSNRYGVELLKGASSHVKQAAISIAIKHGKQLLPLIAKTHFKTYLEVLKSMEEPQD